MIETIYNKTVSEIKVHLVLIVLLVITVNAQAQWVIINEAGGSPDASAALEIADTTRGLLPPRLSNSQMNAISSPAEGLLIYNTDSLGFYYYNGSNWTSIGSVSAAANAVSSIYESGVLLIKDEKTQGTGGGSATSGSWFTRDLNTLQGDTSFAGLSSNQFTLNAGVYLIEWSAPAYYVGHHKTRLYNVSDATEVIKGENAYAKASTDIGATRSNGYYTLQLSSSKTYRIEHFVGTTYSGTSALGTWNSSTGTGIETYTRVKVIKMDKIFGSSSGSSSADTSMALADSDRDTRIVLEALSDDDTIRFITDGVEHMKLSPDGNLGLGTIPENGKLHVHGESITPVFLERNRSAGYTEFIRAFNDSLDGNSGAGQDVAFVLGKENSTNNAGWMGYRHYADGSDSNAITFSLWNTKYIVNITGAGNVGVGHMHPEELLHVSGGTTRDAYLLLEADTDDVDNDLNPAIIFRQDGGGTEAYIGLEGSSDHTLNDGSSNDLLIGHWSNEGIQFFTDSIIRMKIASGTSGYAGVGTASPSYDWHVVEELSDDASLAIETINASGQAYVLFDTPGEDFEIINNATTDYLLIRDQNTDVDLMSITVDGHVGINTTDPFDEIHAVDSTSDAGITIETMDGSSEAKLFLTVPEREYSVTADQDGNLQVQDEDLGAIRMTVDTNGLVGIGNAAPQAELDVDGAIKLDQTSETAVAGMMQYKDGGMEYYNGSEWVPMTPAGVIQSFAGDTSHVPAGWLVCDGTAISRTTYSRLWSAIGTHWGAGDGSTTFNLPDLRGQFLRGQNLASGNDPDVASRTASATGGSTGDEVGSLQDDGFESHNHGTGADGFWVSTASGATADIGGSNIDSKKITNTADTGGNETRPLNANVLYIIKY